MRYELISFDLDGTLVDTAAEIAEAANRTLERLSFPRRPVPEITQLIGHGTRELILTLVARSLERPPTQLQQEAAVAEMDEYYALVTGTAAVPYAGCRETLNRLMTAGVRMACVTNKELRHASRVLEVCQLSTYFDLVIAGDSLAEKKPHASVLKHVARVLDSDIERSAHLGDSAIDIAAARSSGMRAWAVSYGYNGGVPIAAGTGCCLLTAPGQRALQIKKQRKAGSLPGVQATYRFI